MKKLLCAVLLLVLTMQARAAENPAPFFVGYYPSWETGLPIEKIDFRQFTHLIHAFATLRNGVVQTEGNLPSPAHLLPELISYEDPQSVELKAQWVRQAGLRGIFFWEISQDFLEGRAPLVQAARQGLLGKP